jgi:hypothetical protein
MRAIGCQIVEDSIRYDLISSNFGVYFPNHMRDLTKLFVDSNLSIPCTEDQDISVASKLYEQFYDKQTNTDVDDELSEAADASYTDGLNRLRIDWAYLDRANEFNKVYVSAISTPNKFHLQNKHSNYLLERLNKEIKEFLSRISSKMIRVDKYTVKLDESENSLKKEDPLERYDQSYIERTNYIRANMRKKIYDIIQKKEAPIYCLARLRKENEYYRAQIVEYREEKEQSAVNLTSNNNKDKIKVFFVDYGDNDLVKIADIFPICEKFIRMLPFQAIQCHLGNLKPIMNESSTEAKSSKSKCEWTLEAGDIMWGITHDEEGFHYDIYASVLSTEENKTNQSQNIYSVRLYKRNMPKHIDISHELVRLGWARLTKSEIIEYFQTNNLVESSKELNELVVGNPLTTVTRQFLYYFIRFPCYYYIIVNIFIYSYY